jgi:hypothetical protein
VELLEGLKIRVDFITKLRMFYETLNMLEHRPEVPGDVFRDAKLLGFINKVAANLYRDPALNLLGVAEKVKALINAHVSARGVDPSWYVHTGRAWLRERTTTLAHKTGTPASRIEVRELGFHWGSCGKNGVLFFNWRLLQLPVRLIDYIIIHELVHLQEPHHGPEFWKAVDRALPTWRQLKDTLRSAGARFLMFGMDSLRSL